MKQYVNLLLRSERGHLAISVWTHHRLTHRRLRVWSDKVYLTLNRFNNKHLSGSQIFVQDITVIEFKYR